MKHKLTIDMLQGEYPSPKELFRGEVIDGPEGLHLNRTGKMLKYVVRKGDVDDWAVYAESCWEEMSFDEVSRVGNKVSPEYCKNIIEADEEVWKKYRY